MAVCKMWVVRGRLDHPLDYISNSEKTTRPELTDQQLQSLRDVMDYTSNGEKTYDTDEERYLSSINCCLQTARQDMIITKKQWCDESPIIAFHGFQSFKHAEVTPDLAHEIGIRLAEKIWGERFEVVISTHLNTDCIHNHFVVNSTALDGGNRHHGNKASIKRMRDLSDELCKEYRLSVIENPSKFKKNAYLSRLESSGMPTQNIVALQCIEEAIKHSFTKDDFFKQMNSMGYSCDFRESRKHASITPYGRVKPIRTETVHKDYTKEYIYARIRENTISVRKSPIEPALKYVGYRKVTAYSIY
ncbi:MAG: relaxase, partial [Clostridia bacterium]|nr:relaxase [Clostridia bacterium]